MSYTEMAQLELLNAAANVTSQEDLDVLWLTLSLDTNALIQALPSRSRHHKICDRLKQIHFPQLNVLTLDEFNDTLK